MATNTLTPAMAATTLSSVAAQNRNLRTNPKRMAVIKVWDAMMRGARKYCEEQSFVTTHNMPHLVGVTGEGLIRQGMKIEDFEWYLDFPEEQAVQLHSGAGVEMARVARFILNQTDIRACVPFLINCENII